ncbi:hypothetical protein [Lacticaseibacillus absianus]|uniref:hypothetical protein n=1 Tax=Lacticaseibacillus absianus TaxID=2729623 RepID=UPI0015CA4705|nr:hypothetical protein [Lacticaseibacillus absianus]
MYQIILDLVAAVGSAALVTPGIKTIIDGISFGGGLALASGGSATPVSVVISGGTVLLGTAEIGPGALIAAFRANNANPSLTILIQKLTKPLSQWMITRSTI